MPTFSVLVIDDEVDFMETLANRLKKRNIEAIGVPSGEQALSLLKARAFDIVLLDIKMPGGMGGLEVLRVIRRRQPLAQVILLTGHASLETIFEGMRLGALDYLLKPVKLEELLEKITAALEKRSLDAGKSSDQGEEGRQT